MGKMKPRRPRPTLDEIVRQLKMSLPELRTRYGVKSLGVFGSCVHNEERNRNDVDVPIEFESAPTFFEFIEIEDQLSQLLGTEVDLVMKSALKPRIRGRILAEVITV